VWTEACVAATVRDAIAAGFRALLVKDACGSGTEAMHQTAVLNLANRLYGGAITDTAGAMKLMAGHEVEVWMAERPVPILFNYADAAEHYRSL
jgi:maleamate amidohydrolase